MKEQIVNLIKQLAADTSIPEQQRHDQLDAINLVLFDALDELESQLYSD